MAAKKPEEKKDEKENEAVKKTTRAKSTTSKKKSSTAKKTVQSNPLPTEKVDAPKSDPTPEMESSEERVDKSPLALGLGLVVFGLIMLAGRFFRIPFPMWPFIFIIPGALLFVISISPDRENGEGLAITGGIFGTLGLVFLMQMITGFWASWAYIWALIAPTSIGLSQVLYGTIKERDTILDSGWRLTRIGLSILAVGFVFFELIIGISGFGLARFGMPVFPLILIFVGVFIFASSILRRR